MEFRKAERKDVPLILRFIRELAAYENLSAEVVAEEKDLEKWIFDEKKLEAFFVCVDGNEVGIATFYYVFSTFSGRAGLYLEDLFIRPEFRGKGYGKAILKKLASIALERGCSYLEWSCLNWNKPSIDFYLSLGAKPVDDWKVFRITGDSFKKLAE
mgnify:CR=1 FL=1